MKISVCIPTTGRKSLRKLLLSLASQTEPPFEILVVDNSQGENVKKLLPKKVKVRYLPEPIAGVTFARNKAVEEFRGDVLAFIDDDCIAQKSWVENIERFFEKNPKAKVVQGRVVVATGNLWSRAIYAFYNHWIERNINGGNIRVLDTKNCAIKRMVFGSGLRFNNRWSFYGAGEDVDLAQELALQSVRIFYNEEMLVRHRDRDTMAEFLAERFWRGRLRRAQEEVWPRAHFEKVMTADFKHFLKKVSPGLYPVLLLGRTALLLGSFWEGRVRGFERSRFVFPNGAFLDPLTKSEFVAQILLFAKNKRAKKVIFYLNQDNLNKLSWDGRYKKALEKADLVYADGWGVVWAARLLGGGVPERVNAADIFDDFCKASENAGLSLYFIGGEEGRATASVTALSKRFPKLKIAGAHSGFFNRMQGEKLVRDINKKKPDILLVGMGTPKQELWVEKNKKRINAGVFWCVGGLFNLLSGQLTRVPRTMLKLQLEWLYRLFQEPLRLFPRYALGIPVFVYNLLKWRFIK